MLNLPLMAFVLTAAPVLSVSPERVAAPREAETISLKVVVTLSDEDTGEPMVLHVNTENAAGSVKAPVRFVGTLFDTFDTAGGQVTRMDRRHGGLPFYDIVLSKGARRLEWTLVMERFAHFEGEVTLGFALTRPGRTGAVVAAANVVLTPPPVSAELELARRNVATVEERMRLKAHELVSIHLDMRSLSNDLSIAQAALRCAENANACQ